MDLLNALTAFAAVVAAIAASVYGYLTYRLLRDQANASQAQVFREVREAWDQLDSLMLEYGAHFNNDEPVMPLVVDGRLNTDPRLFVAYRFFGAIEEMVLLREMYHLADDGYVRDASVSVAKVMGARAVRESYEWIKDELRPEARAYIEATIPAETVDHAS